MRIYKSALLALVVTLGAAPAWAQGARTAEITPYVAIGSPGASPVGTAVIVPLTSTLSLETDVAYRRGEGDINALSTNASLLWSLPRVGRATPFLGGGVGVSQYGTPVFSTGAVPVGTQSRLALTLNAGGGLKMPLNDRVSLRTDSRWITSVGGERSEQFRVAHGISLNVGRR